MYDRGGAAISDRGLSKRPRCCRDRVIQRCRYRRGDGHVRTIDLYRIRDGEIVERPSYVKG